MAIRVSPASIVSFEEGLNSISPSAGPTFEGKIVVLAGLVFSLVIAMAFRKRIQEKKIPEGRELVRE
jgi:hypothetical protein